MPNGGRTIDKRCDVKEGERKMACEKIADNDVRECGGWLPDGLHELVDSFVRDVGMKCKRVLRASSIWLFDDVCALAACDSTSGMLNFMRVWREDATICPIVRRIRGRDNWCDALDREAREGDLYFWIGNEKHVFMRQGMTVHEMLVNHDMLDGIGL